LEEEEEEQLIGGRLRQRHQPLVQCLWLRLRLHLTWHIWLSVATNGGDPGMKEMPAAYASANDMGDISG
jgi:hypothetical protein